MKLPWAYLKTILSDNKLNIEEEKVLIDLLEKFLDHRKDLPVHKDDDPKNRVDNLTELEIEARAKLADEEKKVKDAEADVKAKDDEAARNALTLEQEKIDWDQRKVI